MGHSHSGGRRVGGKVQRRGEGTEGTEEGKTAEDPIKAVSQQTSSRAEVALCAAFKRCDRQIHGLTLRTPESWCFTNRRPRGTGTTRVRVYRYPLRELAGRSVIPDRFLHCRMQVLPLLLIIFMALGEQRSSQSVTRSSGVLQPSGSDSLDAFNLDNVS